MSEPFFYLVRLGAFVLIIIAIIDKNRVEHWGKKRSTPPEVLSSAGNVSH